MSRWTRQPLDSTQKSLLYLHGHFQRSDTVVLDSQSYQEAYENALVRRLLTAIFERYTVCFVGFSLSDSWFRSFLRQVLAPYKGLPNPYRHVLTFGDDGASDEVAGLEQILDDEYSIDALRYPVTRGPDGREDHSGIGTTRPDPARDPRCCRQRHRRPSRLGRAAGRTAARDVDVRAGAARQGHLRDGISVQVARDVLWTYNSAEVVELLVLQRGWTPKRYGRWVADALIAALLAN